MIDGLEQWDQNMQTVKTQCLESVHIFGTVLFKQSTDIWHEMDGKRIKSHHHPFTSQQQRQRYLTWRGWKKVSQPFTSMQQRDGDILHEKDGKRQG